MVSGYQSYLWVLLDIHSIQLPSLWCSILREMQGLSLKGFNFLCHCKRRIGDGCSTRFWYDSWATDHPFHVIFPRIFALEVDKDASVAFKLGSSSIDASFRRSVRDGVELQQWNELRAVIAPVVLSSSQDRWVCDLSGDGVFQVKEVRGILDHITLPSADVPTRWVKFIPIKINIFAWRARLDRLPTRVNLVSRGIVLESDRCPMCGLVPEDILHVLFRCDMAGCIFRLICRWWDLEWRDVLSFEEWNAWFLSIRLSSKIKLMLEGVFYVAWWHLWNFRNHLIFDASPPRRSVVFDDIVSRSFLWCVNRYKGSFSWETWLKNPNLISL